jgi:hypothetical protein
MSFALKSLILGVALLFLNNDLQAQVNFSPGTKYNVGFAPQSIAAGDLNGDGRPDFVTANYFGGSLSIYTNRGNGDFTLSGAIAVNSPSSVAIADLNGDGRMDIVCANLGSDTLTVLTNKGLGVFGLALSVSVAHRPQVVIATDINNDGKVDLICGSANSTTWDNTLSVLTNNGNGQFLLADNPPVNGVAYSLVAGDVNGDGYEDLISSGTGYINVLTNNHAAGFKIAVSPHASSPPQKVAIADVNGDGHLDLITVNLDADTISVLTNDGKGNFSIASSPTVLGGPDSIAAGDFNGDGKIDLVVGTILGSVYTDTGVTVLTNDGAGGFTIATKILVGGPWAEAVADLNGDGKADLLVASEAFSQGVILFQLPKLSFSSQSPNLILSWPTSWTNWTLQESFDVTTTNWLATSGVLSDGTYKSVSISSTNAVQFFRLAPP